MSRKQQGTVRAYLMGPRSAWVNVPVVHYTVHGFTMPSIDDLFEINNIHRAELMDWWNMESFVIYYTDHPDLPENIELRARFGVSLQGSILLFKRQKGGTTLVNMPTTILEDVLSTVEW
ncbi:hypothetical protein HWV62_19363 [Athelia sp. TMB]|nr:hypothetical protein HWV62_19363 [Athelia sp. TMB]